MSLSTYTSVAPQWTLFPFMSFSCNCSITGWTFIAAGPINSSAQSLQLQLWTPTDHTNSSFSLLHGTPVRSGDMEIMEENSNVTFFRLALDPPLEVPGNTIFGIYQPPKEKSDLILQFQSGLGPESYQQLQLNTLPTSTFQISQSSASYDYPLVAVEHSELCTTSFMISSLTTACKVH